MLLLCIRGAFALVLGVVSFAFWFWLLAPGYGGAKYGSTEYWQKRSDFETFAFGGLGLLLCLVFVVIVVHSYVGEKQ
jgi:hypothetical protein